MAFAEGATVDTAREMIEEMDDGETIHFYDHDHPTLSDPGAFVSIHRHDGALYAMCGNHGWISKWIPVTDPEAVRYLHACAPYNRGDAHDSLRGVHSYEMSLVTGDPPFDGPVDRSPTDMFRVYLNTRIT